VAIKELQAAPDPTDEHDNALMSIVTDGELDYTTLRF